jgi:nicotinic acid mononucleotide adenylyltransferase
MAYENKTYVAFDGDKDIHYYYLMKAWKNNKSMSFNFFDAHDLNTARDTSLETTIKTRLRERMNNAKTFVLLVGENTRYLHKFIRWEIEQAIGKEIPIIVVNINGAKQKDDTRCPPILSDELAIHIPFKQVIVEYALEHWPSSHHKHKQNNDTGPYYYKDSVYKGLSI